MLQTWEPAALTTRLSPTSTAVVCCSCPAAASPAPCAGFTHILKTDDDCYLRPALLLEALHGPAPGQPVGGHLPGLRRALREQTARSGSPLHSDGIMLYNASRLVSTAGAAAGAPHSHDGLKLANSVGR
jgi:hypothetical protein